MEKRKIILSNDDGIDAKGIAALANELKAHYELMIVAPDSERSGAGHSMTISEPLHVKQVYLPGLEEIPAFCVSGTPVDCVKLGCNSLGFEPDMVISGINHGSNLGTDVLYSGTVSAAMEGALLNRPAIAVSTDARVPKHLDTAAKIARWVAAYVQTHPLPSGMVLNVNVPDLEKVKGLQATGLCFQQYDHHYIERFDPRGNRYFWTPSEKLTQCAPDAQNDERYVRDGYAVVTPLHFDLTDYQYLSKMDLSDFGI